MLCTPSTFNRLNALYLRNQNWPHKNQKVNIKKLKKFIKQDGGATSYIL